MASECLPDFFLLQIFLFFRISALLLLDLNRRSTCERNERIITFISSLARYKPSLEVDRSVLLLVGDAGVRMYLSLGAAM